VYIGEGGNANPRSAPELAARKRLNLVDREFPAVEAN